jgi:hypothetical protein
MEHTHYLLVYLVPNEVFDIKILTLIADLTILPIDSASVTIHLISHHLLDHLMPLHRTTLLNQC